MDVLVNNAGIGVFSPLETTSDEAIRHLFETNAFSVMAMVRAIVQHMMAEQAGATVREEAGSHAIYVSKPQPVADIIEAAAG